MAVQNTWAIDGKYRTMAVTAAVIALCLFYGFSSDAWAQAGGSITTCRVNAPSPVAETVTDFGPVVYNNAKSRRELERLRRTGGGKAAAGAGWFTVGLTRRGLAQRLSVKVTGYPHRDGRYCTTLSFVKLALSYDSIDVFIARRYRPGSCEYQSVLDHENEHVNNFRDTLDRFLPKLRRKLQREAASQPGIMVARPQAAADYFQKLLSARMGVMFADRYGQMERADAALDTPRRYRANQLRCENW